MNIIIVIDNITQILKKYIFTYKIRILFVRNILSSNIQLKICSYATKKKIKNKTDIQYSESATVSVQEFEKVKYVG